MQLADSQKTAHISMEKRDNPEICVMKVTSLQDLVHVCGYRNSAPTEVLNFNLLLSFESNESQEICVGE